MKSEKHVFSLVLAQNAEQKQKINQSIKFNTLVTKGTIYPTSLLKYSLLFTASCLSTLSFTYCVSI